MTRRCLSLLLTPLLASALLAQQFAPPAPNPPDEATLKAIAEKTAVLAQDLDLLRKHGVKDPDLAQVEVYHKAAVWIVRHKEWYSKDSGAWTLAVLDEGRRRAEQLGKGERPWHGQAGKDAARAYRSRVDGSVQPYAVSLPAEYGKDPEKKWRLDIVLHGRDSTISEVKFLHQHNGTKSTPKEQDFVRIDIFGRGNNAYRWAGESDVFEAIGAFLAGEARADKSSPIDLRRVVLRGFSMGGAGTWHLGLQHPGRWAVIGPGAGFTTTHGYVPKLPEQLPTYQEKCLHIYDAVDYAENAFDVPVVAYSGDKDPQKAAADNIETALKSKNIPMTHIIAPGLAHQFPTEWQQKAEVEYAKYAGPGKGRPEYPEKIHFVTYTLKFRNCAWVTLAALDRHYERTVVDAERTSNGFKVKTANVRVMQISLPKDGKGQQTVQIDGQEVKAEPSGTIRTFFFLEKREGRWQTTSPPKLAEEDKDHYRKLHNLQGPIDDAFMLPFLCVRGTGQPWHAATHKYAEANLQRFRDEWSQFLRGDLPVKNDTDVTEEDIKTKNLVLFGDPASNVLIGKVLTGLPLKWTKESVTLAGKVGESAGHVPVLIYPNPLNRSRYVVLNSGHTFHAADFRGTNALLYPRLGDYALLKLAPTEKDALAVDVATAGLFDETWQVGKE